MGKTNNTDNKRKSWSEINKIRKEEKRKWREQNLMKKVEKEKLKQSIEDTCSTSLDDSNVNKEFSTVSMAVPGSILENAQSPELRAYLCGQIARTACIFQIDEIVVFDDYSDEPQAKKDTMEDNFGTKSIRRCCIQLGRILQYLECPQYLRKCFFPIHNDLKFSGILNPLNAPHHFSKSEQFLFREGVVTNKPVKEGRGSIVDVGLQKDVHVDKRLISGLRCTIRLFPERETKKKLFGEIVASNTPRLETGIYWGYNVRLANSLSQVFSQCPYKEGYDLTIGTSDKGSSVDEFECPNYKHMLIVFGGLHGLEMAVETDPVFNVDDPELLFNHYLNTLPQQGSKTIRTEEAILISLAALRPKLNPTYKPKEFSSSLITEYEKPSVVEDMSKFD